MTFSRFFLMTMLTLSCSCAKYKDHAEDRGGDEPIEKSCPGSDFDRVVFHAPTALPRKAAVILNGVRKYDECTSGSLGGAPIVTLERTSGNAATVVVIHQAAYPQLPTALAFDIQDLGDCRGPESLFYRASNVTLTYVDEALYGPGCPSVKVSRPNVR